MEKPEALLVPPPAVAPVVVGAPPARPRQRRQLALIVAGTLVAFGAPLFDLVRFALASDLYSYILLIPAISAYVVRMSRVEWAGGAAPNRALAAALLALGIGALIGCLTTQGPAIGLSAEDRLAISTAAFVITLGGGCAWVLSPATLRALLFPLGFLLFMVPLPTAFLHGVERFMQHGSAAVAGMFFSIADTTVFYENLTFQLPGINLLVAPECSGIRSTLVLLIVSVVTGRFFLRSPLHRTLLALAIVPLALLRNGFRIFVIGQLCVHGGPEMIDHFLHRRGGPIFFGLSLIPLFLLVAWLQRREARAAIR